MDAEKDKPLPEKSASFVSRDNNNDNNTKNEINDNNNNNNNNNNENPPEKPNVDQDSPRNLEIHSPNAETPDPEIADIDAVETEIIKEEEEQQPGDETNLEEESKPRPLPLDLDKLSEEIDQYILLITPSASSKDDDDIESTPPPPDVPKFVEQFAFLVEAKIGDYDSSDNPVKWSRLTEEDSASFLEAINRLSSLSNALSKFSSENTYADSINRIGRVLQRAMSYAEDEFKSLLEDYKILDSSSDHPPSKLSNQESDRQNETTEATELENNFPGYSDEILSDLILLSKALIAGGHETECCQVYFIARRNALEDSMHKLRFEKYSIDEVQKMQWESLEREIVAWITTFKQCAAVHFPGEKNLADSIFADHPSISQSLFCSLCQGIIIQLLNFTGAVALTKRAAEKLFKFLDMYEALRDILQSVENLFPEDWMSEIKTEASMIKGRLGEAMISIFFELENSIKADSAKTPVPGGAVHPLTRYTMNYLKYACEYTETLEQVFREHQKIERADSATGSDYSYNPQAHNHRNNNNVNNEVAKQSPFQAQMIKVMDLLDTNLESKSKLYKDHALSSIFMMNNGRYILQKVRGSNETNSLMGDSWCRKRSSDLRQYHKVYQRETWGKLLHCLHPEGLTVNGKVVKPVLKERFKSFNALFDEIHKTQSNWVVSDEQLQSELRVSISNMVIPAYRSFLGRFSQVFTPGRQTEKYVKYQGEDIETYIDELFDGNAAPIGRKKP